MNIDLDGKFAIALPFAIPVLEAIGGVAVGVVAGTVIDGLLDPPPAPPLPLPLPIPAPKMCLDGTNWNGGGGGNHNNDPDCREEWNRAYEICEGELAKRYPNRRTTGGYRSVEQCAKGHVSERCGGNKVVH